MNYESLDKAIFDLFGKEITITSRVPISGGAINHACKLNLSNGSNLFLKYNALEKRSFFETEVHSIQAIKDTNTIGIPKVYGTGIDEKEGISFLLLEYLEGHTSFKDYETFGQELARLHLANTSSILNEGTYGFIEDNYIGAMPQINTPNDSWVDFFINTRLKPQFDWAKHYFSTTELEEIEEYLKVIKDVLIEPRFPSLIHGDLWFGNTIIGNDNKLWLIDPATYIGHYEAELAMTELYGGFPKVFYEAYASVNPIDEGYKNRRDIYNLYHTVNHLNIFGGHYFDEVLYYIHKGLNLYR